MPFEGGRNWSRPPPAHFPVEDGGQDTRLQRLKSSQNALNSFKQLHYDFSSTYAHRPSRSLNKSVELTAKHYRGSRKNGQKPNNGDVQ